MKSFTLTEASAKDVLRGVLVEVEEDWAGVRLGPELIVPVEKQLHEALLLRMQALEKRRDGDFNRSIYLGEKDQLKVTPDDAKDCLRQLSRGVRIDHLTWDPEEDTLVHAAFPDKEQRCIVLVAPRIDEGGSLSYSGNFPDPEKQEVDKRTGFVTRGYFPLEHEHTIGVEVLAQEQFLLARLTPAGSFRAYREGCRSGWREIVVSWRGRATPKLRDVGPHRRRKKNAA